MFKNGSGQKFAYFVFDTTTGAPKTGDAANISGYVNKDWAGAVQLTDTSATEIDATNAKGWYLFDVSQTETNADALLFTGKSTTANISVVGQLIYTQPANFTTLSIDGSGRVDVAKIAGTAQTARDIGASVIAASVTGLTASDVGAIKTKTDFLPSATAGAAGGVFIAGTNAATTVTTSFTTTFTGNLTGSVGSVSGAVGSVTGAVGLVTGNVGGNVTGSVGSVTGLTASNLDVAVSTRLASASYTTPPTANANADALLDRAAGVETGLTVRQAFRLIASSLFGKASGLATTTAKFRDTNDTMDRITATVDTSGNRSAVTLDAS
jgi:hypothetical protein